MLALMPRVLMSTHVPPGPAIVTALLHVGDVVRNQIVPQRVAFVHRTPQLAGLRIDRHSYAVADAVGVNAHCRAVRIEFEDIRTILLRRCRIRVVNIRGRTHRDKHFLTVGRELNVPRPMAIATRHIRDVFCGSARFQISVLIRKAHYRVRVSNIDPLGIRPRRIKVDAERAVQTGGENLRLLWLALGRDSPKDPHVPRVALRDKKIAVGRGPNLPRIIKPRRIKLYFESGQNLRPSVLWTRHKLRAVAGRGGRERSGQVLYCDLANLPGLLEAVVRERGLRRGRAQARRGSFGGGSAHAGRAGFGAAKHSDIGDYLPSLLSWQSRPRWHGVVDIALGNVPEEFAVAGGLRPASGQRRYIP